MALNKQPNRNRVNDIEVANEDEWLNTYADMITLLMSFFLVLISVSKVDMSLWEQIKQGLRSEIAKEEKVKTPLAEIKKDLDSLLIDERQQKLVSIDLGREGIVMKFASSAFYKPGKATIGDQAKGIINKVDVAMQQIDYYPFAIDIEGHTDNVPIHTLRFPSNWELSVARATNIVKYLVEKGLPASRMKAAGYADTKPVAPNKDSLGNNIPENQAMNRRIVIRIH